MRPPRRSWFLTVKALRALLRALDRGDQITLREARIAIEELETFVNEDEECEQP